MWLTIPYMHGLGMVSLCHRLFEPIRRMEGPAGRNAATRFGALASHSFFQGKEARCKRNDRGTLRHPPALDTVSPMSYVHHPSCQIPP